MISNRLKDKEKIGLKIKEDWNLPTSVLYLLCVANKQWLRETSVLLVAYTALKEAAN